MNGRYTLIMRISDNGGQSFGETQVISANSTTSTTANNTNASSSS
ncbi:hypothetical protein [Candidatus Nitrosocosmicus sp. FF01]